MSDTTFHVIAYDIPLDRRRTKVHNLLSGYGMWTQFSLFECFLTDKQVIRLRARLHDLIDTDEDKVRIYSMCAGCVLKVETIGGTLPEDKLLFIE